MAFDPDKYLADNTPKGFDPDAYLAQNTPISLTESALRGGINQFGVAPAVEGGVRAVGEALQGKDLLEAYQKARDLSKKEFEAAEKANPKASAAGNLAGAGLLAALTGGVSAEGAAAKGLAGLTGLGAETAAGALTGAGYGALSGTGEALSAGEGLEEGAKDAASGAAGGALLGGAVSKLAGALGSLPESLESLANKQSLKAAGFGKSAMKNMIKQDVKAAKYASSVGEEPGMSQIDKIGSLLGKSNPYQETPVITAGVDAEEILSRAQDLQSKAGEDMGSIIKRFDALYSTPAMEEKFVNPLKVSQEIQSQLVEPLLVNGAVPEAAKPVYNTIQSVLDTVNQYGDQPIPFAKAEQLKGLIKQLANYEQEGSASNQVLKRSGGIINAAIEDAAQEVGAASSTPDLLEKYKQAKDLYGAATRAVDASTGKVAGEMANRALGPTDYAAGIAGAAAHGGVGGLAAAAGNKLAKTYGNTVVASGARKASEGISSMSQMLTAAPKEKIVGFGKLLSESENPLANKLGDTLMTAANKDDVGKNALMYSIMQNPGYRELLRKITGQKEPQE